ncbi:MAG TPA: hemerythrin domain-containing protein, partial [Chroococcales cyanobacterium]
MGLKSCTLRHRAFLIAALGTGLILSCSPPSDRVGMARALASPTAEVRANVEEILPVEDLMREHGVLRRILFVYQEAANRLEGERSLDPKVVRDAAGLVKRFIEDYHEKLEEDSLFPRFEKAGKLRDLVAVLKEQHQAGRRTTAQIFSLADSPSLESSEFRKSLAIALRKFIRMYGPHAAREDTVLFPSFRSVVSPKEYDEYADLFEDKEH